MKYKKIYNKLISILKDERAMIKKYKSNCECEKLRMEGQEDFLNWVINELLPEIEGKKCNMVLFNKSEFKEWKKEIKK